MSERAAHAYRRRVDRGGASSMREGDRRAGASSVREGDRRASASSVREGHRRAGASSVREEIDAQAQAPYERGSTRRRTLPRMALCTA